MPNITIVKASPLSQVGARLNQMALDHMAFSLAGSRKQSVVDQTFDHLWRSDESRFSHQYAYEAVKSGETLGIVTCYPVKRMDRLAWPTFRKLLASRKLGLIGYHLANLKELYSILTLKEGKDDEFHVGTLATMPESRGLGVGAQLLNFAEEEAKSLGYEKISLTVRSDNVRAAQLYERVGYRKVSKVVKPSLAIYRMVKMLY